MASQLGGSGKTVFVLYPLSLVLCVSRTTSRQISTLQLFFLLQCRLWCSSKDLSALDLLS